MSRLVRLAAATVLVAAAGLTGSAPAYAAACSTATGVSVVVDFHELGGGLQQVCDAGGGDQKASSLFPDNGFPLDYVQRQPGFVCRVSDAPADDPCVNTPPANAYWGVWWSDGTSSGWTYSSVGVGSLTIPDGGSVALSWNGSSAKSPPGAPPPQHSTQEPTGKPAPTKPPPTQPSQPPISGGGTGGSSGGATDPGDTTSPGAAQSGAAPAGKRSRNDAEEGSDRDRDGKKAERARQTDSTSPTDEASTSSTDEGAAPVAAEPPTSADDSALPVWVGPVAVGGLLGVAGVATYLRRRTS